MIPSSYEIKASKNKKIYFQCSFETISDELATEILNDLTILLHKKFDNEISVDLYRKVWVNGI